MSNTHQNLMQLMRELGYLEAKKMIGVCHGIALMAIQAHLTGNIKAFNERLAYIDEHPDLIFQLDALEDKQKRHHTQGDTSTPLVLSETEKKIIDIIAFLDGIQLYQNANKHHECFERILQQCNTTEISELVASVELEKLGGLYKATSWAGIYSTAELNVYVEWLHNTAQTLQQSFSLQISSDNHAIALHYDHDLPGWYATNAGPIQSVNIDLAAWIKDALMEDSDMTLFSSHIFVTGNEPEIAERLNELLNTSAEMTHLRAIRKEKANLTNGHGATLALIAAQNGDVDTIITLRDCDADFNIATDDGATPLLTAAAGNQVEVIHEVYAAGVDINATDAKGNTAAMIAAQDNALDAIDTLAAYDADLDQEDEEGRTAVFIAAEKGHASSIYALFNCGANINKQNKNGATPVFIAAQYNNVNAIDALIDLNADLNIARRDNTTPLSMAAEKGNLDSVITLCEGGANVNITKKNGTSPLFLAAQNGHKNTTRILLDAGADCNQARNDGCTPVDIATQQGHAEIVDKLRYFGAMNAHEQRNMRRRF